MRHPSGTAHPFAKSVKGWGTRTRIKFPTSRKSGEKWGTRTGVKFPTSRKSGEKWGTRADQLPHFSQKRREMGHPSGSNSPLLAKAARNGAPERIEFPTSRKSGEKWGTQLHLAHPFAKSAKDGAPARIKFPTSRKSGEKWGTQLHLAHPFAKSAKGWGTRPDQIPHFSQKRREMGHPSGSNSPLL